MIYQLKNLTEHDMQVIFTGLGQLRLDGAVATYMKLRRQVEKQEAAAPVVPTGDGGPDPVPPKK